jgi:hypothetical protein
MAPAKRQKLIELGDLKMKNITAELIVMSIVAALFEF